MVTWVRRNFLIDFSTHSADTRGMKKKPSKQKTVAPGRGGFREGAGRKPEPKTRKVVVSVYLSQPVVAYLRSLDEPTSAFVDGLIRDFAKIPRDKKPVK